MRIKSRYGFIHYGLFEASKEKDFKAFSGIPLFCFNKQWLIIRILCHHETHKPHPFSLVPLSRIELYKLSPRVEFKPRRRLWYCTNIKKRIRLSDIYGNHSGENYRMRIKSRYGFIHYGLFEASKEKDYRLSPVSRYFVSINNG